MPIQRGAVMTAAEEFVFATTDCVSEADSRLAPATMAKAIGCIASPSDVFD
jgi:hypothetical protein